jgi:hypothetical protein
MYIACLVIATKRDRSPERFLLDVGNRSPDNTALYLNYQTAVELALNKYEIMQDYQHVKNTFRSCDTRSLIWM